MTLRSKTAVHDPYATSPKLAHRVARPARGTAKDYLRNLPSAVVSNEEYAAMLNEMKRAAVDAGGIPLHITLDAEGCFSCDYPRNGIRMFPLPMGIGNAGEPKLAYEVAWAIARQFKAVGFDWIHSPVVDVNTEPLNSEISARSYGETPEVVCECAVQALKGFREGGLVATAKHYPGRGPSVADAHHGLPVIDASEEVMRQHMRPYQALIAEGLPCVMTAHSSYTAFDDADRAATLSRRLLTDVLKGEFGFKGVVTTDDITMGGIVERYEVADAVVETISAGADLVLMRDDSPLIDEVIPGVVKAVQEGRIPEERINDAVTRVLRVKSEYGMFEGGNMRDEAAASSGFSDPEVIRISDSAALATTSILRDNRGLLPVKPEKSILLVEQTTPMALWVNQGHYHPGILWKKFYEKRPDVASVETTMGFDEDDKKRVTDRIDECDIVVITNFHWRRGDNGNEFVKELHTRYPDKPIVVVTNNPYPLTLDDAYGTVVMTYGIAARALERVVELVLE